MKQKASSFYLDREIPYHHALWGRRPHAFSALSELIIMPLRQKASCILSSNAHQRLCCINTFFSRHRRSNTPWGRRPHCDSQFAHLIAIHGINWWSDGSSMAIAASNRRRIIDVAHPKDNQILSMPIKSINLLIAIRTRARLNRFILCHWRHLSDCQQQLVNLDFWIVYLTSTRKLPFKR